MEKWYKIKAGEDRIVYKKGNDILSLVYAKGFWSVYTGTENDPLEKVVYKSKIKKLGALFMGRWIMQHNRNDK